MMHDVLQPTEIAFHRSSSVAHLYVCLDRSSKAWVNSQDLLPFAWFLLVDFSLAIAIDDETGHARSGAKKYRTRSRKKVSGRRFKTRSVGLVEAETFFYLALVWNILYKVEFPCGFTVPAQSPVYLGRKSRITFIKQIQTFTSSILF